MNLINISQIKKTTDKMNTHTNHNPPHHPPIPPPPPPPPPPLHPSLHAGNSLISFYLITHIHRKSFGARQRLYVVWCSKRGTSPLKPAMELFEIIVGS